MILYHGTDAKYLDSILKDGLLPRKCTGNIVHTEIPSNPNFTYLTRWNPVAHAYTIENVTPLIIKVDVNDLDLYPDEDWIERLTYLETGYPSDPSKINVVEHKEKWKQSLDYFGTVATHQVTPKQIVDFKILNPDDFDYHCGIGAHGNTNIHNRDEFKLYNPLGVQKYLKRLKMLFEKGWEVVKKDILYEKPASILDLPLRYRQKMHIKSKRFDILATPEDINQSFYILNAWHENHPDFPIYDQQFSKLLQYKQ